MAYVLEKREFILFCTHQNVCSAYCQQTNQLKMENLDFLYCFYIFMFEDEKNHLHILVIHYPQSVTSGPKIEPCGTPHVIDALSEYAF